MLSKIKTLLLGVCLFLFVGGIVLSGCTQYANQEDLRSLDNQKKAALAAEQKLQECESAKADLQRQIQEKQKVVDKLTKDRDAVKE